MLCHAPKSTQAFTPSVKWVLLLDIKFWACSGPSSVPDGRRRGIPKVLLWFDSCGWVSWWWFCGHSLSTSWRSCFSEWVLLVSLSERAAPSVSELRCLPNYEGTLTSVKIGICQEFDRCPSDSERVGTQKLKTLCLCNWLIGLNFLLMSGPFYPEIKFHRWHVPSVGLRAVGFWL